MSLFSKIMARFQFICGKPDEAKFLPDIYAFCKSITEQGIFWVLLIHGTAIYRYTTSALDLNAFCPRGCHNVSNVYLFFLKKV